MHSPSAGPSTLPALPGKGHPPPRAVGQRIRVTNRSRLRIYYGSLDADTVILDEDGSGNGFATAGVDAEDAKEHHLQVVLSLQSLEGSWSGTKEDDAEKNEKDESTKEQERRAFIPVPDAAGVVADSDYEQLYAAESVWKDSTEYIRFSDNIDESLDAGLRDGYTYDADEEDEYWMERHEQDPEGSGCQTPGGRISRVKTRGKELDAPAVGIQKPEYELVMGLVEMFCDGLRPTLHTDMSKIPGLPDLEENFVHELEEDYFATYEVPSSVPTPERLWSLVRTLYPYWKDRKLARGGHRIMPQLNTDETIEDDHFVCFRRRDPKAIRRTRRSDTSHIEKLARLRMDFEELEDIARSTLLREQKKVEQVVAEQTLYEARRRFSHVARRPEVTPHPEDDKLLLPNYQEPKLVVSLPKKGRVEEGLAKELHKVRSAGIAELVAEETKQAYRKRKLEDEDYENQLDTLAQPKVPRVGPFEFQWVPQQIKTEELPLPPRTVAEQGTNVGFRMRRGRGGTVRCDRLLPRRRTLPQSDLFTTKPLVFDDDSLIVEAAQEADAIDDVPALSSDSDMTASSSESDAARESFRRYFFGIKQASADPDLEDQGVHVVDDYDLKFQIRRANLHDPGKANPLQMEASHLMAASMFVREARAKETKVPLWPSLKPTLAPVRISGLKAPSQQQPPPALGLQLPKTHPSLQLPAQPRTPLTIDTHAAMINHAAQAGHRTPSGESANPHAVHGNPSQPPMSVGDDPTHGKPILTPHHPRPPSSHPDNAISRTPDGSQESHLRHPIPSAVHAPVPNGLGLQLGPTDLKLSSASPTPAGAFPPQHPPQYGSPYPHSRPGSGVRPDQPRSPVNSRVPQPGMPAAPPHGSITMPNYPMYQTNPNNAAATAAYYAQTMNGLGLPPGQPPQVPPMYNPMEVSQYYTHLWQQYHSLQQAHGGAIPGSRHPQLPGQGDVAQHFIQAFRTDQLDPQSFGHFPPANLNLHIPQVRQKTGSGPPNLTPLHISTPDRQMVPGHTPSQPGTYPTPLTRPPSEPRNLDSSPSRLRPSTNSSDDDRVSSSPAMASTLPTTPISQPGVSQCKSPID